VSQAPRRHEASGGAAMYRIVADLQEKNGALRDALERYGGHTAACEASAWAQAANPRGRMCICGWSKMAREFKIPLEDGERV